MLSGVGVSELVLLFVIGLLILGPERLPRVASQLGRWVGKARRTANQLRFQMEREIALADIERTQSKKREDASKAKTGEDTGKQGAADGHADGAGDGATTAGSTQDSDKSGTTGAATTSAAPADNPTDTEPKSNADRTA